MRGDWLGDVLMNPTTDPYGAFEFLGWMLIVIWFGIWIAKKEDK